MNFKMKQTSFVVQFMFFLDELAEEKDIQKVSLRLVEVLYAFLHFESLKYGPKNWFSE